MTRRLAWLLVLALATTLASAQQEEDYDSAEFETWVDVATIHNFDDRWRYDGDYGTRSLLTTRGFWQLYGRPSFRYRAKSWLLLHGGLAWFHTRLQDDDNINEVRPWVGIRFLGPHPGRFKLSHYFRAEYRAFKGAGLTDWEASVRVRYQLQLTTPRFKIGRSRSWYAMSFIEGFSDAAVSIDELETTQFRFNIGLGKKLSNDLRVEVNYLFQKVAVDELGLQPSDHILRVRFFLDTN